MATKEKQETSQDGATETVQHANVNYPKWGPENMGQNCVAQVDNNELYLRIKLDERWGESGSGKSVVVATTSGIQQIPGTDVSIGLNIFVKKPKMGTKRG